VDDFRHRLLTQPWSDPCDRAWPARQKLKSDSRPFFQSANLSHGAATDCCNCGAGQIVSSLLRPTTLRTEMNRPRVSRTLISPSLPLRSLGPLRPVSRAIFTAFVSGPDTNVLWVGSVFVRLSTQGQVHSAPLAASREDTWIAGPPVAGRAQGECLIRCERPEPEFTRPGPRVGGGLKRNICWGLQSTNRNSVSSKTSTIELACARPVI